MSQLLAPDAYAKLNLDDEWIEREMQNTEARWILDQTADDYNILELGFGNGIITRALAKEHRVTMVDGASDFCIQASRIPDVSAVHCMFEDFEPSTKSRFSRTVQNGVGDYTVTFSMKPYDCVIASFILEHIRDPVGLLTRARQWSDKLIVVVGNANSYHRQMAVKMGIQAHLASLSARDKTVGHLYIFDLSDTRAMLRNAGWIPTAEKGLMLKTLPNSMLAKLDPAIIKAMCEIEVEPDVAANIGILARGV